MTATSQPTELRPAEGWAIGLVATAVMAVSYVDRQTFAALSPTVCRDLGIGQAAYGALVASFSLAYLLGAPLAGWLLDGFGARRGLVVALFAWSAVSALHALVPGIAALFLLRVALGAAESPSFPGAAQSVQRSLPPKHRSAGFGLLFTGSSVGAMIAAPLAIRLSGLFGWRFAFLGVACVGLAWIPLWFTVTRSPRARAALESGPPAAAPAPMADLVSLAGTPAVLRGLLLIVASAPAVNFLLNWLPKYLVAERGVTQQGLAAYLWVPPIAWDLGAVAFGVIASASGGIVRRGHLALASALCAAIALFPLEPSPWGVTGLACVSMAGGGGVFALLTADMLARVDRSRISSAGGLCAAAQSLAYILANLLIGAVLGAGQSYAAVLVTLGLAVLPGAIAWLSWPVASGGLRPA